MLTLVRFCSLILIYFILISVVFSLEFRFTVDQNGEVVGQIAESITKFDEFDWDVKIKEGYKFSDGTPVDAEHVKACLMDLNDNNDSAKSSLGTMVMTVMDPLTVRIQSERPSHVMDVVLAEWVFVIYYKNDAGDFVYTGPYKVESFGADAIELLPNPYYDNEALNRPEITLQKFADGHALADAAKALEIDVGFHLPIDTLPEIRDTEGVSVKSFEVGYHYMMFHNMDSLSDVSVRKAIDLAVDRTVLSQALSGGTGTRSLFPDYSPYFQDDSDPHGSPDDAAALLEEAGWVLNADGIREKDGEVLSVHLVAYPHRPGLVILQPVIADALSDLGMNVTTTLTGQDWSETSTIINERTFDLLLWAQHTLPAGDPNWFLSAFFRSDGGNNHANLSSEKVDGVLDLLSEAEDHQDRVRLAGDAQTAILEVVPVSNLVTPYWHVSLSDRMGDYEPWGSDYYVIRPDLFVKMEEADDHGDDHKHDHKEEDDPKDESEDHKDHDHEDHEDHADHLEDSSGSLVAASVGILASLVISAMGMIA